MATANRKGSHTFTTCDLLMWTRTQVKPRARIRRQIRAAAVRERVEVDYIALPSTRGEVLRFYDLGMVCRLVRSGCLQSALVGLSRFAPPLRYFSMQRERASTGRRDLVSACILF
ncbi:unnamed protein product [Amoebophrya sp. A25]|nr:unnamed protein product [Amoebophrya sp. A25]|eukprot:GSA25T00008147001.1